MSLFASPIELSFGTLWMLVPISVVVATVYKTLRTTSLRRLPLEIALLAACILAGMGALMAGFWALITYWPH